MSTTILKFFIDVPSQRVSISGVSSGVATNLAANVGFVRFENAVGSIIYNDRPAIPDTFTDPSPYQSYLNAWITAQAALQTNPLTLAQAQAVKVALVQAVYAVKRQQPVTVTVNSTSYQWDASDIALARMAAVAGNLYADPTNSLVTTLNSWATSFNTLQSNLNTFATNLQTTFNNETSATNTKESGITGWVTLTAPTSPSSPAVGNESPLSSLSAGTIQIVPVGATAAVTMTPTDLKNIMAAIATQNTNEAVVNANKTAAVNALSTISAVAAYDATTGW